MSNFNKVILMGRLTRDPELRHTTIGTAVAEIGLAVNRKYRVGVETGEETTFVDVTFWAHRAEAITKYLKKGDPLHVEGRLQLDTWEQDGQKRSKLKVVAENFQFLGSANGTQRNASPSEEAPVGAAASGNGQDDADIPF